MSTLIDMVCYLYGIKFNYSCIKSYQTNIKQKKQYEQKVSFISICCA